MDRNLDPLAIYQEAEKDMSMQKPFHCLRCHFVWFGVQIEWVQGLPIGTVKRPDYCPCCASINWEKKEDAEANRLPSSENGVLTYCRICDMNFYSRESWLKKQESIRKNKKHPWLPERVEETSQPKEKLETVEA